MRKAACLLILLAATTAHAQLVYVKCCTKQRPALELFLACMSHGGPNVHAVSSFRYRGESPVSCLFGFADSIYSINMMARMCWDNAPDLPQPPVECSSWVDTSKNIAMTCGGRSTGQVCIDIFDYDADVDLDLRDYAFYQNHFEDLRPL